MTDRATDASPQPRTGGALNAPAPARPRAVIRFEDVHFWQGTLQVLDGVSFEVPEGQVTVVMGPSGTGKSTLLWLMLGLWKPDSGRVFIDDEDTTEFDERKWKEVRRRLSMVFQENALFDSLTVGENVGYCLFRSSNLSYDEIEDRVRETLQLVELDPDLVVDRNPDELSGGQKRRVAGGRPDAPRAPPIKN
jgi:phospholipid/cholesterol/gamma-HCH transport system ATP-binding protein